TFCLTPPGLGWGLDSRLRHVCVEFACSPHALGISSGYSSFVPRSKDMHCRLIGISKLSVVCVIAPSIASLMLSMG
ncbi:hypothetical protein QTP70_016293, partial [Hemibagrus guttatus]